MEDGKCILIEDLYMHKKSEVTDVGKSILWTDGKVEDMDVEINLRTPDFSKSMHWPDAREEDVDVDINLHTPGFPVIPTQTQFNEGTAATRSVPASSSATVTQSLVGTQKPTSVTTQSQSTANTTSSSQSQTPTATTNTISASNSTGGSSRTGASGSNSSGGSCSNSTRASGSNSTGGSSRTGASGSNSTGGSCSNSTRASGSNSTGASGSNSTGASCSNSISASYSNSTRDSGSSSTIASGSNSTRSSGSNSTGASGSSSTTVKTYLDKTPRKMATSRFFYKGFTGFKWIPRLCLSFLLFGNVNPKVDWKSGQSDSMVHVFGGTWNLICSRNDSIENEACIWSRRNLKSGKRETINFSNKLIDSKKFEIDGAHGSSILVIKNLNEEDIRNYCYYCRIGTTYSECKDILDKKNHIVLPSKTAVTFPMNKTIQLQSECYPNLTFFMIIQNIKVANQTATKKDNNRLYKIDMTFNGTLKKGEQFLVVAHHENRNFTVYYSTDDQITKHKDETGLSGWEIFGVVVGVVVVVILIAVCIVCACKKKQAKNDENVEENFL